MTMRKWIPAAVLAIAGCGGADAPPEPTREQPTRFWFFNELREGAPNWGRVPPIFEKNEPGELMKLRDYGGQFVSVPSSLGDPARTESQVYSSETGKTYWTWAEAPHEDSGAIGAMSGLTQRQTYLKLAPDATLRLVISKAFIEAIDFNGDIILSRECPWALSDGRDACLQALTGSLSMSIDVFPVRPSGAATGLQLEDYYFTRYSKVQLQGFSGTWERSAPWSRRSPRSSARSGARPTSCSRRTCGAMARAPTPGSS